MPYDKDHELSKGNQGQRFAVVAGSTTALQPWSRVYTVQIKFESVDK